MDNKIKVNNPRKDENILIKPSGNVLAASCAAGVPLERFEVFQDTKPTVIKNQNDHSGSSSNDAVKKENEDASKLREPFQEILVDTPMSVTKALTPMSVDKLVPESSPKTIIPVNDRDRFFEVEEYQADILAYLKTAELSHRPKHNYMRKQPDLTHTMRTILVDWLVEVGEEYRLHNETLYLAVSYVDRFLSYMSVVRGKLQLVGTAAMFIAA